MTECSEIITFEFDLIRKLQKCETAFDHLKVVAEVNSNKNKLFDIYSKTTTN